MNGDINLGTTPLTALSYKSRILLSSLLNSVKVLPSPDADKLPRDWQGLAALINIPFETLSDNRICQDKTAKVLEIWLQKRDGTATVGTLISYLQRLDRYDICDDLQELLKTGQLLDPVPLPLVQQKTEISFGTRQDDLITNDDMQYNCPQWYHAYVLYAKEDKDFVDVLLQKMRDKGLKMCTEDDLLPGFHSQFGPISTLISERCHKIILVYSPDFFKSSANHFFMDYVQADGIETKRNNIIPCMYRSCDLPRNHKYYHKLYYTPPGQKAAYDFWQRLSQTLEITPRITNSTSTPINLRITEVPSSVSHSYEQNDFSKNFLPLPQGPEKYRSTNSLNTQDCKSEDEQSLSNVSHVSEGKSIKKGSKIKRFLVNNLKIGKKQKNKDAIMVKEF